MLIKIETHDVANEEILISLFAKQTFLVANLITFILVIIFSNR